MADNITFTSNIKFVKYSTYKKLCRDGTKIGFAHNEPNILKTPKFFSMDIRTCTGGGLLTPHKEAEGFHFLDDVWNKMNFSEHISELFRLVKNPKNALLVGSKNINKNGFSVEQFQNFKKVFQKKVKNVTIFEEHNYVCSETHYHYSLEDDTWTLCSRYWSRDKDNYLVSCTVSSMKELIGFFRKISIAPSDNLFIGKTQISPEDYPKIFQKK